MEHEPGFEPTAENENNKTGDEEEYRPADGESTEAPHVLKQPSQDSPPEEWDEWIEEKKAEIRRIDPNYRFPELPLLPGSNVNEFGFLGKPYKPEPKSPDLPRPDAGYVDTREILYQNRLKVDAHDRLIPSPRNGETPEATEPSDRQGTENPSGKENRG